MTPYKPTPSSEDFEKFLEKIKSLQIQTSKTVGLDKQLCPHCGKPLAAHKLLGAICSMVRRHKQQPKTDEEQSFAA